MRLDHALLDLQFRGTSWLHFNADNSYVCLAEVSVFGHVIATGAAN